MQITTVIDAPRRAPLFEGLSDDELRRVAEPGSEKLVRAGERNGLKGEPVGTAREVPR